MVITSFGPAGYPQYGKRFIEGFIKYWSDETLIVYHEGDLPDDAPVSSRVIYRDLVEVEGFVQYAGLLMDSDPLYHGMMRSPDNGAKVYNYRFDAFKFFRKVLTVNHYQSNRAMNEPFAWVDADVTFKKAIPKGYVQETLANKYVAFLGRPGMYTETGYLAFDPNKDIHGKFFDLYWNFYASGAFRYLSEWHDCWVFDTVLILTGVKGRNLGKGCDPAHPFEYSMLGTYMSHLKGPDKEVENEAT